MAQFPSIDWAGLQPVTSVRISTRARSLRLRILPPDRIELVVPKRHDGKQLPGFVEQHRDWLIASYRRMLEEQATQQTLRKPPEEICLPATGECWRVTCQQGGKNYIQEYADHAVLVEYRTDEWPQLLQLWLADRARQTLAPALRALSAELELPYQRCTIRGQKTRWGSCSSKKNINLNWRLLFLPPQQVRYLMVHELCHTVHLNHSPKFWALVVSKMPDYQKHDRAMRMSGKRIPAWAW